MNVKSTEPPKYTKKRLYKGNIAVILVGYCPDTLDRFVGLYKEAKKDFPGLKPEDVTCSKVTKSDSIQGYTIIMFPFKKGPKNPEDWEEYGEINFNY